MAELPQAASIFLLEYYENEKKIVDPINLFTGVGLLDQVFAM
jgi:hypothetical protein